MARAESRARQAEAIRGWLALPRGRLEAIYLGLF
jgi:hypothetical protein